MVRYAQMILKIGVHSPFDPNNPLEFVRLILEKFGQAYYAENMFILTKITSSTNHFQKKVILLLIVQNA